MNEYSVPCKDCTDRCPGCHSKCGKYNAYRSRLTARNEYINQQKKLDKLVRIKRRKRSSDR